MALNWHTTPLHCTSHECPGRDFLPLPTLAGGGRGSYCTLQEAAAALSPPQTQLQPRRAGGPALSIQTSTSHYGRSLNRKPLSRALKVQPFLQCPQNLHQFTLPAGSGKARSSPGTPTVAAAQAGAVEGAEAGAVEGAEAGMATALFHTLPSSLRLEVLVHKAPPSASGAPKRGNSQPPLVFIHGSYHAAWCWREHWMPFFARRGYDCYAISLLGQGASDSPPAPVAGTIQSHALDVSDVIRSVVGTPPVLIGHSFGGLIVQAYLSLLANPRAPENPGGSELQPLSGAALLCSVPPSGNKDLVVRYLLTKPVLSIKVTLAFAAKMFATNTGLCRDSFFSPGMSDKEVERYQALMAQSSKLPLFDLRKLNSSLPVPRPPLKTTPPLLVLGAEHDAVLDVKALQETGEFFGSSYTVVPDIAHDVMLDLKWESAAQDVLSWLDSLTS